MIFDTNRVLRNEGGETVDEIVISGCTVHLEQMDTGSYWIGITRPNVEGMLHINLNTKRKAAILCTVDDSDGWVWDEDKTHPSWEELES